VDMKRHKRSLSASVFTFLIGTSCCWLASLAAWMGGATMLSVMSNFAQDYQFIIRTIAFLFFTIGLYQFWKYKKAKKHKAN